MRIHHQTQKKARTHGIELTVVENEIVASKNGTPLATGLMGNVVLDQAIARLNGSLTGQPGSRAKLAAAFKNAPAKVTVPVTDDGGPDDDAGDDFDAMDDVEDTRPEGASIIKRKYKEAYRPHSMTCGDNLARDISAHVIEQVMVDDKEVTRVSLAKLRKFAKANDCWVEGYASLNIGQARMNVGNRLRAKVKKGYEIIWD